MQKQDHNMSSMTSWQAILSGQRPIVPTLKWLVGLSSVQRLRYPSEGMSTIKGAESSIGLRSIPVFEIVNYEGPIELIITCISSKEPFRLHPHRLISRDTICRMCSRRPSNTEQCQNNPHNGPCIFEGRCANGYFRDKMHSSELSNALSGVGLLSLKRNKVQDSIQNILKHNVDPFDYHRNHPNDHATDSYDMKHFRLCIQAYINYMGNPRFPLEPLLSDEIKANDLVVRHLCRCSASVLGNEEIMLFGANITKDVMVKVYEVDKQTEKVNWQVLVEPLFSYRRVGLCFKTPAYYSNELNPNGQVYVCLVNQSDGAESEPMEFEYIPVPVSWIQRRNGEISDNDIITSLQYYINQAQIADIQNQNI